MKMLKSKAGVIEQLGALGVGAITLLITLVVVFLIASNIGANASVVADANATNAVNVITTAAGTIPGWVGLVILVAIGGLLLFLVRAFRQ